MVSYNSLYSHMTVFLLDFAHGGHFIRVIRGFIKF